MVKNLLVAWDGSEQAQNALRYAIEETKRRGLDNLTAVYAETEGDARLRAMLNDYKVKIDEDLLRRKRSRAEDILEKAKSIGAEEGVKVETHFIPHDKGIAVDIVRFAEDNGFDHIVVGSHGRSGIAHIALGSVAEGIVKRASCIVTVVRCEWSK